MQWPWLQDELDRQCEKFAALLRSAPDPAAPVPGLDWTVGEVGAHVLTIPQRMLRMLQGEAIDLAAGRSGLNATEMAALPSGDLATLAIELEAAHEKLRLAWGDDGGRRIPWYHLDLAVTEVAGIWLGELLIHGLDLAAVLGVPWKVRRDQALAITDSILAIAPHFLCPEVADLEATFHLKLRGGPDYTLAVSGGQCRVEPGKPERADIHVSADPVAFVLVGYGRRSQWPAILTGKIMAWGRKPQLAFKFGQLFENP